MKVNSEEFNNPNYVSNIQSNFKMHKIKIVIKREIGKSQL